MMKKPAGILVMALALMACTTMKTNKSKEDFYQKTSERVADSIQNRTFTVELNYVTPRRTGGHHLTSPYSVRVEGDSIYSYLPYFGVAYRADWNSQYGSPLDFKRPIKAINHEKTRKGYYRVWVKTVNNLEQLTYYFEIFDNGKASLDVMPTDREPISFTGEMTWGER